MRYVTVVTKVRCTICGNLYSSDHADTIRQAGRLYSKLPVLPKVKRAVRIDGVPFMVSDLNQEFGMHGKIHHFHSIRIILHPLRQDAKQHFYFLIIYAPDSTGEVSIGLYQQDESVRWGEKLVLVNPEREVNINPRLNLGDKIRIPLYLVDGLPKLSQEARYNFGGTGYYLSDLLDLWNEYNSPESSQLGVNRLSFVLFARALKKQDWNKIKRALRKYRLI